MTSGQKIRMGLRVPCRHGHRAIPAVGNGDQPRVCLCPEPFDQAWQGIVKVLVLAVSESVSCHHYATAEEFILSIQCCERCALVGREEPVEHTVSLKV